LQNCAFGDQWAAAPCAPSNARSSSSVVAHGRTRQIPTLKVEVASRNLAKHLSIQICKQRLHMMFLLGVEKKMVHRKRFSKILHHESMKHWKWSSWIIAHENLLGDGFCTQRRRRRRRRSSSSFSIRDPQAVTVIWVMWSVILLGGLVCGSVWTNRIQKYGWWDQSTKIRSHPALCKPIVTLILWTQCTLYQVVPISFLVVRK
jgi:hypothetical protein